MKKVYIITDMEGISGVLTREQTQPGNAAYEEARHLLVDDINAAVAGAFDAGADEVLVNDGHGGGMNIPIRELDPRALLYSGIDRKAGLDGLDESVAALVYVGYHAMSGTQNAILEHTQSSVTWTRYTLNGRMMGEIGQMAVMAGAFGIPPVFVSGDEAAVAEAKALFGDIEGAAVKKGFGRHCGICLVPSAAHQLIRAGVKKAVSDLSRFRPFVETCPYRIELEVKSTEIADLYERNGSERLGPNKVGRTVDNAKLILGF